ncbi:tetratricopeptide repeat protein [Spartinivicinus poritis]|uniref:Tetratricopeptide repeat protein n=1 Tax=Spartinivicinus poritis TaxID=2994640 RepID=A0ABT5U8L2_9GAMM|nr:tetratricopeptide repeat protein [Spartinivicinus sp. A2-2]MDE1462723.1 tetratricopeptide repeat protein [Spartinivicinus sp. A2-2]
MANQDTVESQSITATGCKGLSLYHGFRPTTNAEKEESTANHLCIACDKKGQYITGDIGPKRTCGELLYYKAALRCRCGFMNYVYVIINDLKEQQKKGVLSSDEAIAKAQAEDVLPQWETEELLQRASAAAHNKHFKLSRAMVDKCLEITPKHPAAWYNLGWLATNDGNYPAAIEAYQKAQELSDDFPSAALNLGHIYQELGKYQHAIDAFTQFLDKYPKHAVASRCVRECKKKMGE